MPKVKISEYSATANSNTDVASINIDEGCAPSGINNAIRAVMGHLKDFQQGTNGDPFNGPVNGTLGATTASTANVTTLTTSSTVTHNGGTANGVAYLNGSKVLTTGSALSYDGATLTNNAGSTATALSLNSTNGTYGLDVGLKYNGTAIGSIGSSKGIDSTGNLTDLGINSAANLDFATGYTRRMRLDSAGNLGVGVTPSGWNTYKALEIGTVGNSISGGVSSTLLNLTNNAYYSTVAPSGWKYANTTTGASLFQTSGGAYYWYINNTSGTAGNAISFTQAMTLDSSGNLGIGTTSPSTYGKFAVINTDYSFGIFGTTNGTPVGINIGSNSVTQAAYLGTTTNHPLVINTNNTERARIDSSGNLLVGDTTTIGTGGKFQVKSSTDTSLFKCTSSTTYAAIVSNVENTAARLMAFQYGSGGSPTNVGTITTNGTGVTYGTSSDYRLKENIVPMTGALDKVAQLKPVTYKWKINGSDGQGFIAHELAEVVPDAVQGEKDAIDADGNPTYQGIDTSYLVATLTAAIQEQSSLITQLTARITALESA